MKGDTPVAMATLPLQRELMREYEKKKGHFMNTMEEFFKKIFFFNI